jgi:hypothetical protein
MSHPYDPNAGGTGNNRPDDRKIARPVQQSFTGSGNDSGVQSSGDDYTVRRTETTTSRPGNLTPSGPQTGAVSTDSDNSATTNVQNDQDDQSSRRRKDKTYDPSGDLYAQEKAAFGGIKFGSAFLGWLTSLGAIGLLTAILAAVADGLGFDRNTSTQDLRGAGIGAAIAILVVLFLAYLAGGYVAGRMARFQGVRQGIAVWLWGVLFAVVIGVIAAVAGDQSTVSVRANLPQIPFTSGEWTVNSILALLVVLAVTLIGAILGGLLGMRFHRRVDRFARKV